MIWSFSGSIAYIIIIISAGLLGMRLEKDCMHESSSWRVSWTVMHLDLERIHHI